MVALLKREINGLSSGPLGNLSKNSPGTIRATTKSHVSWGKLQAQFYSSGKKHSPGSKHRPGTVGAESVGAKSKHSPGTVGTKHKHRPYAHYTRESGSADPINLNKLVISHWVSDG